MKSVFENIIEKLEEQKAKGIYDSNSIIGEKNVWAKAIEIVKQEAEQYEECYTDCGQCEAYDKEKHYCPKWCDVIKGTVAEIEENHSNDFCEWKEKSVGGIELVREPHRMKLFHIEEERKFCPYCGKKIKVVE